MIHLFSKNIVDFRISKILTCILYTANCVSPTLLFAAEPMVISAVETVKSNTYYERATQGTFSEMGSWEQIKIPVAKDRMQGVHTLLLPNGKVLLANGSSNRNQVVNNSIQNGVNVRNYSVINNVGLFDPTVASSINSGFTRIPAQGVPNDLAESNDLFCSGQLHLPDGNVLFAGGTQSYYGQEQFQGSKAMRVYHWQTNEWKDVGPGKDGHWYPSLIPLENGQLMVISGLAEKSKISPWLEFYDPRKTGQAAWQAVDISKLSNSPWNTRIIVDGEQTRLMDGMQMYPRIYPLKNNKFLLTHDGAGWDSASGSETAQTYIMSITFTGEQPQVSFEHGADRKDINRVYGTAVQEPISGDILLFAGQEGKKAFNNNDFGPGPWGFNNGMPKPVRVTSAMERFKFDANKPGYGVWDKIDNFFGDSPEDARMMHFSTILPTKQLLVMNGGNYAYHRPLFYPILLDANNKAPGGYQLKQMNQALEPRLYHNVSILLPDGRVLSAGGNASRAAVKYTDGNTVDNVDGVLLNTYKDPNGAYHLDAHGEFGIPAEIWRMEIFSPPYLYIEGERPVINALPSSMKLNTQNMPTVNYGKRYTINIINPGKVTENSSLVLIKLSASTHAWDSGQRLIDLPIKVRNNAVSFTLPALNNINVPGYYMLFYVNDKGQPSVAKIIQLTDQI